LLLERRQLPKYFKIVDITNNKELDNASLDIPKDKKSIVYFTSIEEAKKSMEYYAAPYYTLGMKIEMRIDTLNEINETLASETFLFE